ncbi:hypothetical protein CEXT_159951 [Caerostris extrusa]|uniref:LAGLIDADG homing endonuclease n=1 Tax=Caerostris extrusa TaxID=172846 RepID=A0AAV4TQL6_CAEEX|nr:hypothetical protein CEXT_159951 [Caerostris extrusa]
MESWNYLMEWSPGEITSGLVKDGKGNFATKFQFLVGLQKKKKKYCSLWMNRAGASSKFQSEAYGQLSRLPIVQLPLVPPLAWFGCFIFGSNPDGGMDVC